MNFNQIYFSYFQKLEEYLKKRMTPLDLVDEKYVHDGKKKYINFGSNDYLGLRTNQQLIKEASKYLKRYGVGLGSSRLVTGNLYLIEELEKKIAHWKKSEAALIMNSGYQLNVSILRALFNRKVLGEKPSVFIDKGVHASIYDGCDPSQVDLVRFRHNDLDHLESQISKKTRALAKFILTESVFSMTGEMLDIERLYKIREKNKAFLVIDEAHAIGVYGENGLGLATKADLTIGTFGKAFGGHGSFLVCSKKIRDYLISVCRGLIYSTAPAPAVIGAISAGLEIIPKLEKQRQKIFNLSNYFKRNLKLNEFEILSDKSHIISILIGDATLAKIYQDGLRERNIWVKAMLPPTVPKNQICIRFSICAFHETEDIDCVVNALCKIRDRDG